MPDLMQIPWAPARQTLLSSPEAVAEARALTARVQELLALPFSLELCTLVWRLRVTHVHWSLGYVDLHAWWKDTCLPGSRTSGWWEFATIGRALEVAPALEQHYAAGLATREDLFAAGKMAKYLHTPADVELVALDKSARRAEMLRLTVRGIRHPDDMRLPAVECKTVRVPVALITGDWRRVLVAYKKQLIARKVPKTYYNRAAFGTVCAWLVEDWLRLRALVKRRASEVRA